MKKKGSEGGAVEAQEADTGAMKAINGRYKTAIHVYSAPGLEPLGRVLHVVIQFFSYISFLFQTAINRLCVY
jgi:hypothetical protein